MLFFFVYFFFFKQKTAYEVVSGDWSSDVCSSDLDVARAVADGGAEGHRDGQAAQALEQHLLRRRRDQARALRLLAAGEVAHHHGRRRAEDTGQVQVGDETIDAVRALAQVLEEQHR